LMSNGESRLWAHLRDRRFAGHKFRRQFPIGPYIADFACKSARLIVETDGDQHGSDEQQRRDTARTEWLKGQGWRVLRFWTNDLASSNIGNVLDEIFNQLEGTTPSQDATRVRLPS